MVKLLSIIELARLYCQSHYFIDWGCLMNTSQEQLLRLLTLTIHGGVPTCESFSSIDGDELYKLALQQNVCALVYSTIIKYPENIKLEEQIMRRWKHNTLLGVTRQLFMMDGMKPIFDLFSSSGIPVISLKGLTLKQLYPQPELREMSDLDLFIEEKDMARSIEVMKTQGYHPRSLHLENPDHMHIEMDKSDSFTVELHRTLWPLHNFKKKDVTRIWFNHIWENKRQLELEGIQFTALPLEDELINMVIHLAKHIMNYGSDLRQFCDIVFFLKAYWHTMDVEYVDRTIKSMDLFLFYQYLLTTCHLFLGLDIPVIESNIDISKCEILMSDTLNFEMMHLTTEEKESWIILSSIYFFARNNQLLMPLAFVIEVGRQIVKKKKTLLNSISFSKRSIKAFSERARFLRSIGLLVRL